MSGSIKLGLIIIAAVLVSGIVWRILAGIVGSLLGLVAPLAIVVGVGLIVYGLVNRKALGGGRRYLP